MFRLFISTPERLSNHFSTQKRKVISQAKNQIQFSPKKYPRQKLSTNQLFQNQYIDGLPYLFHKHDTLKSQKFIVNQSHNSKPFGGVKSNILAGFSLLQDQIQQINQKLKLVESQIENVDWIESLKNKQICIIIIFKNSLICETFYKYFAEEKQILSVYLQSIIIYQQQLKNAQQRRNLYSKIKQIYLSEESLNSKVGQKKQWIQLPKCSICLQKLEEQLTGFSQNYLKSLQFKYLKYAKTMCQTCQVIQQRQSPFSKILQKNQIIHCNLCKQKNDIWVCMICGQLGCGRYKNADAYKHFIQSGHIIALDLQTHRVWNYLQDCFSHSLKQKNHFQNQQNNILKFPKIQYQENMMIQDAVLQGAFWEYCSIFSQQMQKQRIFYLQIRKKQKKKFQQEINHLDKVISQLQKQKQLKRTNLKKINKNKYKVQKKQMQITQQARQEKQKLSQFQHYIKSQINLNQIQEDQGVLKKINILSNLENQINQVLAKLSQQ